MPRKPPCYCTLCGTAYTRAERCRNHIKSKHPGSGFAAPEIEYIIGRLGGTIKVPQKLSRPSFKQPVEKGSSFDKGYWEELGRMSAHHNFKQSQQHSTTMRTNSQAGINPPPAGIVAPQGAIDHTYEGLFGITAFICEKCYTAKPRMLYERSRQDRRDAFWAPSCISTNQDFLRKMKLSKEEYWKSVSQTFPEFLKGWVEEWTAKNPTLSAVFIQQSNLKVERVTIVRDNQNGTTLSVTLPYSDQHCTKFDDVGLPGWAFKAIRFKHAPLTEEELIGFLRVVKRSTFGFFKVSDKKGLIGTFLLHIQNINYDEKNQREFLYKEQDAVPVKTAHPSSLNPFLRMTHP